MRTTIILPDEFARAVRERARAEGLTFTSFLEQALREHLDRLDSRVEGRPFAVVPFEGTGLRPGVDLADSAELLDRMER
ncbi:ribbon-helix-helix protein, CopG family [Agromyces bracchium]|uniref:Ribbon-helix-helix protein, CopG family n=1 Tax=Agromyces bracchium TaxID=88376 RepID=A0A6I3M3J4_9MICO|nr:ribbon-helix-helix protein, CopG family [Agromyces bracchium]MTH68009.1 ribbon-helix-helix protein, CopG family [Agromyces bracchium]